MFNLHCIRTSKISKLYFCFKIIKKRFVWREMHLFLVFNKDHSEQIPSLPKTLKIFGNVHQWAKVPTDSKVYCPASRSERNPFTLHRGFGWLHIWCEAGVSYYRNDPLKYDLKSKQIFQRHLTQCNFYSMTVNKSKLVFIQ